MFSTIKYFRYTVIAVLSSGGMLAMAAGFQSSRGTRPLVVPSNIQQTMDQLIDPAADSLWDSVGTEETTNGIRVKAPQNDTEWQKVAEYAQDLIAGAKRLQKPRLPVGANAHSKLADADIPGTRNADQIRADIDAHPEHFRAAALRLEKASNAALIAARSHNPKGVLAAGAALDAACEACHAAYWYPQTKPLHLPPSEEFAKTTIGQR